MLTMILAIDKNNLVGNTQKENGLPWHYKEDLLFYKNNTICKRNLMGRKTYEAIGRALPNRETYVLTSNKSLNFKDSTMLYSLDEALELINSLDEEIMLVGGVSVFEEFFDKIDKILLTRIEDSHEGDVYYSSLNSKLNNFTLERETLGDNKKLRFQTWIRKI